MKPLLSQRALKTLLLAALVTACSPSAFARILYEQHFANRIDYVSFPYKGWQAYCGKNLQPLPAGQGGVEPDISHNDVDMGYAAFNRCPGPLLVFTQHLTNNIAVGDISEITWYQNNDSDLAWHIVIQVEERKTTAWYYSVEPFANDKLGRWEKKSIPMSSDITNWLRVTGVNLGASGKVVSSVEVTDDHPDFPVRGIVRAIGFMNKSPDLSARLDSIVVSGPDEEPGFELSPTMLVVIIGVAGFVIFSIFLAVYDRDPVDHPSHPHHH